ncbi:MAG: septum formation protein Maf [Firmicutes bacterium]|jgi:septum formation protein|nr:Maf family protein [Bacillota bacterium]NLO66666.1 septum formation protein Maf [Bacillota bacterium]
MDLILASQSPRRRDLLTQFGVDFSVQILAAEEIEVGEPLSVAEINAVAKAVPVSNDNPDALVLGADTIVVLDGEILGKPADLVQAEQMLRRLSGREHSVTTAVALATGGQAVRVFSETTAVRFRHLDEREIRAYLATGEPLDKAGAYGIQGFGGLLVESIKGCYYNVVGLPLPKLAVELRAFGIEFFPQCAQGSGEGEKIGNKGTKNQRFTEGRTSP